MQEKNVHHKKIVSKDDTFKLVIAILQNLHISACVLTMMASYSPHFQFLIASYNIYKIARMLYFHHKKIAVTMCKFTRSKKTTLKYRFWDKFLTVYCIVDVVFNDRLNASCENYQW